MSPPKFTDNLPDLPSSVLREDQSDYGFIGNRDSTYDPACGSGGMFVRSEKFVESHCGKQGDISSHFRDRRKEALFIDARKLGTLIDRVHRELTDADLEKIISTYHS